MRHDVPVMVVSDETKILPTGFPQFLADDRPPEEVWIAPAGVRVWNRYFEPFELERITAVVTDSGALHALAQRIQAIRGVSHGHLWMLPIDPRQYRSISRPHTNRFAGRSEKRSDYPL